MPMERIKPLIPTLREKKRYIAFEIISKNHDFGFKDLEYAVKREFKELYGTDGEAKAGMIIVSKRYDEKKQMGVIRVNNKYVDRLKLSLAMVKKIKNTDVIMKTIITSGMIKIAAEKINA
jgi:ribonuclease P/MRP protein subunit POP5